MNTTALIRPKQKKNYLKLHKTCKCGNPATTVDHIIPCHIFSVMCTFEMDYRNAVRDMENWQPMCKACNTNKSSTFDISEIPSSLYMKYKDIIDDYIKIRHKLYIKSGGKCKRCSKSVDETECVIYLKDQNYIASVDNGYLVCPDCLQTGKGSKK